ncbi:MAG: hypothetical protein E6J23_00535 [Chloroflexi bacterium]|nr:MAG: hypothetical protein E6J23_00535 [Chloroflexota bacterium]
MSALLFSVLTTRLQALSLTLRVAGHTTVATAPSTATGVASNGVVVLTPLKASMTPDQVLLAEPLQV